MKILLLGKNGQVGWELQRALAPLSELISVDRTQVDLTKLDELKNFVNHICPDIIVNAAAYTGVDKAESDAELAYKVNTEAVSVLAEAAKKSNAWLVHYSTDYVYDGKKKTPYKETDQVNPLSIYGKSKLAGEDRIRASGCKYLNFRTSWVFAAKGNNFAKSILRLAAEKKELNIVADQFGAPTSAELIADVTALCLQQIKLNNPAFGLQKIGTYHLAASGETSWHSYAQYVVTKAVELGFPFTMDASTISAITAEKYPLPAIRPCNSGLNTNKIEQKFSIIMPLWSTYIDRMLVEIIK